MPQPGLDARPIYLPIHHAIGSKLSLQLDIALATGPVNLTGETVRFTCKERGTLYAAVLYTVDCVHLDAVNGQTVLTIPETALFGDLDRGGVYQYEIRLVNAGIAWWYGPFKTTTLPGRV